MSSSVSLQVKCVIEALAAEGAQVALCITVALHVPVQQPLEAERLGAHSASESVRVLLRSDGRHLLCNPGWIKVRG